MSIDVIYFTRKWIINILLLFIIYVPSLNKIFLVPKYAAIQATRPIYLCCPLAYNFQICLSFNALYTAELCFIFIVFDNLSPLLCLRVQVQTLE